MSMLEYTVTPVDAPAHRYRVEMRARVRPGRPLRLNLATWIPGSYVIRDFARHLLSIAAYCEGEAVPVTAVTRASWECLPTTAELVLVCEFHALDASVRAAYLDDRRGFFNFTSLAIRPEALANAPCRVTLAPPTGIDGWQLATTLAADSVDGRGFGTYHADSYWDLIDQPVAMGAAIEHVPFTVRDVPHAFVLLGRHDADTRRLAADLAAVCEAQAAVFGELPAAQYLFLAQIVARGYGGLEHRESSVLQVARDALPAALGPADGAAERSAAYETLLGLCSHEYFHLWNVKRIRPAAVAESDLSEEAHFRDLWAYEGVTSYYDDLALVRAGLIDEQAYLDRLARLATRIERTPGRHRQSLAQSSFDAWLKFYRPDENTPNAVVSYYGKGAQFALALDLMLRLDTGERASLDDVMRRAWSEYGRHHTPMPENGLAEIAGRVSGLELAAFFDHHLNTTADAPWAERLAAFGVRATCAPAGDDEAALLGRLGLRLAAGELPRVLHVLDGTPARAAGLAAGDRLIAFDGLAVDDGLGGRLARHPAGARIAVHLLRGDELLERTVTLAAAAAPEWHLTIDDSADAAAHARRRRWLSHGHDAS
ncbi:M61 family metallopeptidase [Salinisphaera orenii]|uniref:Peptidase M61 n=1 Tax=Salinisphaera orenii YIM 95161 TaxID=1051139 RepID=A0A423PKB6_9GAMM|nr:PDZ domain-containing protein [Salinisphaera halophila]ROO26044.1 peptidase M61 [Salinisphaera halophila YIM 95161]